MGADEAPAHWTARRGPSPDRTGEPIRNMTSGEPLPHEQDAPRLPASAGNPESALEGKPSPTPPARAGVHADDHTSGHAAEAGADLTDRATDLDCMGLALEEAERALEFDEVPIGAVIVMDGRVLGRGHNLTRTGQDPTAHAEIIAIRAATGATGYMRLPGATIYTTVEPCFMCAGALMHARVTRVVWAVRDPKFGGCASIGRVLDDPRLNHQAVWTEGVRAPEARDLLQSFFRSKRAAAREAKRERREE